ncbi:facilitated trehalose transporter Tret1-like [Adelges cooleyi]|uniref:facilitated trehalose transporter Tret1-like n=1 Tax=Adelges cooleyi TaxID=133065 RepID=UPI00218040AD|nr:facilitated trehalose transporter Tret1-like [Adelges cooleyi]
MSIFPQVYASVIATLGALAMGIIIGWSSPAEEMLEKGKFDLPFKVTVSDTQLYGSMFGVGAAFGALPAGYIGKLLGRCLSMAVFEMFLVFGWICLTFPKGVWMLIAGRVLLGIGVGALCAVIPSYVGEISQPHVRGSLGSMFQVLVVTGILYSYSLGAVLKYQLFNFSCGIWSVIHMIGVAFIPESPYYYLNKNKVEKAEQSLKRLRSANENTSVELVELKKIIDEHNAVKHSFLQVMSNKANRKALLIGMGCMFFQQCSGVNMVVFYMKDIFDSTGSKISSNTSSIIVGFVQLFMTLVTMAIADKVGRRILLIGSGLLMGFSYLVMALYYKVYQNSASAVANYHWVPLVAIALYVSAFSLGFGPIPWVVMGEIFSNEVKPYGTSIATFTNWFLVFCVTYMSHELKKWVGNAGTFFTFSMFCFAGALFAILMVPETKSRTLAEIQAQLTGDT